MAIARLSVKVGRKGSAGKHASYIARQGQYASRLEKGEKLEATEYGNMPSWAAHDPSVFWNCADALERKNGTAYREFEIALPRELTPDQRIELVRDFCQQEIGDKHAYQWAIHTPTAVDGGEQPHCHLMFSERLNDGIHRDPTHYFKQYNANNPTVGGAQKAALGVTGYQSPQQRKDALLDLRDRWEKTCNKHLEMAQKPQRIDMRSYQKQGIDREPERKMLPSEWSRPAERQKLVEYRYIRKEKTIENKYIASSFEGNKHADNPVYKQQKTHFKISRCSQRFVDFYRQNSAWEKREQRRKEEERQQQIEQERLRQEQLRQQREYERQLWEANRPSSGMKMR